MASENSTVPEVKNGYLGPTSITRDHVQRAFADNCGDPGVELLGDVDAQIIGVGQGFTSFVIRLQMEWRAEDRKKHGDKKLPRSAVLKSISKEAVEKLTKMFQSSMDGSDQAREVMMIMLGKAHETECVMYRLFSTLGSATPVPVVQSYALWSAGGEETSQPPLILLEDISDHSRVLGDGSASLTLAQMFGLAEALADLHAWCWTTKVDWRSKLETFEDRMEMMNSLLPMVQAGVRKAKEAFPDEFQKLDEDKVAKTMTAESMLESQLSYKSWMPDVLVHGDFWANNVMFDKLPDGSMGDRLVAFIDWQISYVGNPMYDLGRVSAMSFDHELRKAHFPEIVKRYYDRLDQKLGPTGMPKEMSYERVLKLAHEQAAANCLFLLFMQDMLQAMMAPADSPEDQVKRERLIKRCKGGIDYAIEHLDIGVNGKTV